MKYETRLKAIIKKLPKEEEEPFVSYFLEKDDTFLGPNDKRLTWEELDALDANIMLHGWQKYWTQEEREASRINARRHILQDRLKAYHGKTDATSLERIADIEARIQEEEDELKRKGLPIEEDDTRPLAGGMVFKMKGRGWLQGRK